jgi:hypothetical protein
MGKQLYRVKLYEGHTAKPKQVSGEYLGNYATTDPALYSKGEAQKKAKMFGGKIEPFGKVYHFTELKVMQLSSEQISEKLMSELRGREEFVDTDNDLDEAFYSADVFEAILCEVDQMINKQKLVTWGSYQPLIDELLVLNELSKEYQYVMLISI